MVTIRSFLRFIMEKYGQYKGISSVRICLLTSLLIVSVIFAAANQVLKNDNFAFKRLSGNVIVKYQPYLKSVVSGKGVLKEHQLFIASFEKAYNVSINFVRPVYSFLIEEMVTENATESAIHQYTLQKRLERRGIVEKESRIIADYDFSRVLLIRVDGLSIEMLLERVAEKGMATEDFEIVFIQPERAMAVNGGSNDPYYGDQWGHPLTQVPDAWDFTRGDTSIVIGIIDTGIDYKHEDLRDNIKPGFDFVDLQMSYYEPWQLFAGEDYTEPDDDPMDYYKAGHGTHVAGIAAAVTNNLLGISGVCPKCRIMPLRCGAYLYPTKDHSAPTSWIFDAAVLNAIVFAVEQDVSILNLSFGGTDQDKAYADALDFANENGVVLVASAGNENTDAGHYPSDYENVISVANTNSVDRKSSSSNFGINIDISAPGENMISCIPKDTLEISGVFRNGKEMPSVPAVFTGYTDSVGLSATIQYIGLGRESDIENPEYNWDLAGKIALIRRGEIKFIEKTLRAQEHGAIAILLINNSPELSSITLNSKMDVPIPVVLIGENDGQSLLEEMKSTTVEVNIKVTKSKLTIYKVMGGTSMSAPFVSGVAGLILSKNKALSPTHVRRILVASADTIDYLNPEYRGKLGAGRVNAYKALIFMNMAPRIVENIQLEAISGKPLLITAGMLDIEDPDNVYPDDFRVFVFEGENYTLKGDTIIPNPGFKGIIEVPVTVSDGIHQSEREVVKVNVCFEVSNEVISRTNQGKGLIRIYPNPSNGEISIESFDGTGIKQIVLRDQTGRMVMNKRGGEMKNGTIDLTSLSKGLYLVTVFTGKGDWNQKVMIF
jgi:subtilisin family serine protease